MVGVREISGTMRPASGAMLSVALVWFAGCSGSSKGVDRSGGSSGTSAGSLGAGRGGVGGAGGVGTTGGASGSLQGGSAGMNGTGGSSAGTSGGGSSGSSGTGGSGGEGAVSSSGSGGESGEAGASASGGSSGMGSSGAGSSVGGQGPAPGFPCFGDTVCDTGKRCVACQTSGDYLSLCVPDPDEDASGYAAATAECESILRYVECDGPEDCAEDEYCAWVTNGLGAHCVTEAELPNPFTANCCFDCSALPVCTLCWSDADCPETQACVAQAGSPRNVGGCRPPN